jgi:hypothetical protein
MFKFLVSLALAVLSVVLSIHDIGAQEPTQQQRDAIRAACRSDFIENCSGVQPGGKDALECLVHHSSSLSASCKTAVEDIASTKANPTKVDPVGSAGSGSTALPTAAPSPGAVQPRDDQLKVVQQACTLNDFVAHCSWIAPTSPELLLCLKANTSDLSPACLSVVQSLAATQQSSTVAAPSPAEQESTVPKTPKPARQNPAVPAEPGIQKPTAQQLSAIRAACRSDFIAHCGGVQPGGTAALQCLQRNSAHLSPGCQSAVATLGQSQAAPATAGTTSGPAVAPLGPMPMLRPREALAILRLCGADQRALCPGVQPGGGHVVSCLAEHAAALSPTCYDVLSAAARR